MLPSRNRIVGLIALGALWCQPSVGQTLEPPPAPSYNAETSDRRGGVSRVSGIVRAQTDGRPLAGVHVFVAGTASGTVTDTGGRFALPYPDVSDTLVVQYLGFAPQRIPLHHPSSETLEIVLAADRLLLSDITVSATRERQDVASRSVAIGRLDREVLRDQQPTHPSQVLSQIAGVWVNHTSGEGHMTSIRQPLSTDPLYLYLENGIPTRSPGFFNHNALYEINLPQADGIEIIKGPGSALYGSDAIGGVIDVTSARIPATPSATLTLDAGSFGYARSLLSVGTTRGDHGLQADVNATRSTGWRTATDYNRQSVSLRWDVRLPSAWLVSTVGAISRVDQAPAGIAAISEADFRNDPTQNYQPISYRRVLAVRLSTRFERWTSNRLITLTPFVRYNTMKLLPNWSLTYDPSIWEAGHATVGLQARLRHDVARMQAKLIAGADMEYSPGFRIETAILPTREGKTFTAYETGTSIYDYEATFAQLSPYLHVEARPHPILHVSAGLRLDQMLFDYQNQLSIETTGKHRRPADKTRTFSALSPKLGATVALADHLHLFASWRHAFRVPSESQLFRQGGSDNSIDLSPVRAVNTELGLHVRLPQGTQLEGTVYHLVKRDDILDVVLPDGTLISSNAGRTRHRGIEFGIQTAPWYGLSLRISGTYAEHRYMQWDTQNGTSYTGNGMEIAPRWYANGALTWTSPSTKRWVASIEHAAISDYWMDPANTARYDGHRLWHAQLRFNASDRLSLHGRVHNLADTRYAERATYNAFRGDEFAPGNPRSAYVSVRYRFR